MSMTTGLPGGAGTLIFAALVNVITINPKQMNARKLEMIFLFFLITFEFSFTIK